MIKLRNISVDTVAFPWANSTPRHAVQSVIAVAIALVVGHLSGHSSAGAIAAGAAYTVGFAVFHEAMASTLLSMALLTAGIASATLAGSYSAEWTLSAVAVVILASVNYGLLAELGPTPGWIGQQCGVFVIISSGFPGGVEYAVGRASMVIVGGVLQMIVFAATFDLYHPSGTQKRYTQFPLYTRFQSRFEQLVTNLKGEVREINKKDTLSYMCRLALTLTLATLYYRRHHLPNGYWAPMTALLVLRPEWGATLSRGVARLLGTVAGATVAVLYAMYLPLQPWLIFVQVIVCAWASYALQAVNYALFSFFLTLYVVYSFRFGGFSQPAAAHYRMLNTAIGGGIALTVDAAWLIFAWFRGRLVPQVQESN
jgi:hypothetical protein